MRRLYLGCTRGRHAQLGVHAVINARGGQQWLNEQSDDERELYRDAQGMRAYQEKRIRWYGPHSKFFRRHRARIAHLIAHLDD